MGIWIYSPKIKQTDLDGASCLQGLCLLAVTMDSPEYNSVKHDMWILREIDCIEQRDCRGESTEVLMHNERMCIRFRHRLGPLGTALLEDWPVSNAACELGRLLGLPPSGLLIHMYGLATCVEATLREMSILKEKTARQKHAFLSKRM